MTPPVALVIGILNAAIPTDIVALAPTGNRAHRVPPRCLQDYAIFGTPVRSPCRGEIVTAVDGLRDSPPDTCCVSGAK